MRRKRSQKRQTSLTNEIEEQLRKQRLKQQQERESEKQTTGSTTTTAPAPPPKRRLGKYVYDRERKTYFPHHCHASTEKGSTTCTTSTAEPAQSRASPYGLAHSVSLCSLASQRRKLVSLWGGRALLESMSYTPVAIKAYRDTDDGNTVQWKYLHNLRCAVGQNGTIQRHLPTWCRTFDVANSIDRTFPVITSITDEERCYLDIGSEQVVFSQPMERISVVKYFGGPSSPNIGAVMITSTTSGSKLYIVTSSGTTQTLEIPFGVNDCDRNSLGRIMLGHKGQPPWSHLILDTYSAESQSTHRDTVRSDVLCVKSYEALSPHMWLMGHRNGRITLLDDRDNSCVSTSKMKEPRNIVNIACLASANEFLSRDSIGCVRLYDARMLGQSNFSKNDPSVVHELGYPGVDLHSLFPGRCSGIAMDPSMTTVLSPFIDKESNPHIGAWTIHSGEFVGSKPLARDLFLPGQDNKWSMVELCETVTRGFHWCQGGDNQEDQLEHIPGKFGLWYKLNHNGNMRWQSENPDYPGDAGNIHLVCFSGRFE